MTSTSRIMAAAWLVCGLLLAGSCADETALLGSGASLTTTPCTTCAMAERPNLTCPAGAAPRCFTRTDGTCGWKAVCSDPPVGSVCPQIGCATSCPNGFVKDTAGCDTCSCQPPVDACGPVCTIYCQYGNVPDGNGCPTCKCNPPPNPDQCGPVCAIACQYGNVPDTKGCPTCQCNPPPKPDQCGPVCTIYCQYGNVSDAKGCPTCACNPAPGGGGTGDPSCPAEKCTGPMPKVATVVCADGKTIAGPVCVPAPDGICAWTVLTCPDPPTPTPTECAAEKCPGPIPPYVPYTCPDGKTVAGPRCEVDASGACVWKVYACP